MALPLRRENPVTRIWQRIHLHNPNCMVAFHVAGAGKGCAAWVAVLREADARKSWQKLLPEPVARAVNSQKREPSVSELAHGVLHCPAILSHCSRHLSGLPLLTVYLRRESGVWYDIAVRGGTLHRAAAIQSRQLQAACEAKFLDSVT